MATTALLLACGASGQAGHDQSASGADTTSLVLVDIAITTDPGDREAETDDAGPVSQPPLPWTSQSLSCGADTSPPFVVPTNYGACDFDLGAPPDEELVVVKEWEVTEGGGVDSPIPVVNLTDDNGDGVIDAADTPDLLVIQKLEMDPIDTPAWQAHANTTLRVYSGDGGGVHWEWPAADTSLDARPSTYAAPAGGDIDSDGLPEVVLVVGAPSKPHRVVGLSHYGAFLWESSPGLPVGVSAQSAHLASPSIADIDHDGCAEILAGSWLLDCQGSLRLAFDPPQDIPEPIAGWEPAFVRWFPGAMADLDMDGSFEFVFAHGLYGPDGHQRWPIDDLWGHAAIADFDGDGLAEILTTANDLSQGTFEPGRCAIFDSGGEVLAEVESDCSADPALVEDLDGDGVPEFVVAAPDRWAAYHADGSILWAHASTGTGPAFPVAADLEGDGRVEVVVNDESSIRIIDGPTGALRWVDKEYISGTGWEYPVVADVDADGRAEFVLTRHGNGGDSHYGGFTVYGSGDAVEGAWAPARPIWNQADYHQTNVEDDGSIPLYEVPHFTANNSVRSAVQPPVNPDPAVLPVVGRDVSIELAAACASDCDNGALQVVVWVLNSGFRFLPKGIPVSLRRESGGLIQVLQTDAWISKNQASAPLTFSFKASDAGGEGLIVTVDDDANGEGIVDECDESNNALTLPPPACEPAP